MATRFDAEKRIVTPLLLIAPDDERWLEFVGRLPTALPFHHPSWSRVLSESYGYRSFVVAVADESGGIESGMPIMEVRRGFRRLRWVSLPFTDRCPPLGANRAAIDRLIEVADHARKQANVGSLEFHADLPRNDVHRRPRGVTHLLTLDRDPAVTFSGFSRSQVQRNVRKGERSGLTVRRGEAERDVTEVFYRLHVRTRRRLGVPVQPHRLFDLLWRHVIARGLGFVLLADREGVPVAGAIFLTAGNTVVYKFGASEPSYWRLRPNHLIFWNAIRWSCENGFATFDFGRSDLHQSGLRSFKSGWGAVEKPLIYASLGDKPPRVAPPGTSLLTPLIRRGPLWLCRAIGEAAYRRAA